jgi:hypothetical protein
MEVAFAGKKVAQVLPDAMGGRKIIFGRLRLSSFVHQNPEFTDSLNKSQIL